VIFHFLDTRLALKYNGGQNVIWAET